MIHISGRNTDNPTQDTDLLVGNEAQRVKLDAPSQDIRCLCKYERVTRARFNWLSAVQMLCLNGA